jgi:Flp pilus assembly protein TadG
MRSLLHAMVPFGRAETGANVVEFAIVLPVLLTLLFGVMEASRAVNAWLVVTQATRAGARFGITGSQAFTSTGAVNPQLTSQIQQHVATYASNMGVGLTASGVTVICSGLDSGGSSVQGDCSAKAGSIANLQSVQVQSSYTVTMLIPLIQALTNSITVNATSIMRAES